MLANLKFIFVLHRFLMEISRKCIEPSPRISGGILFLMSLIILCLPKISLAQNDKDKELITLSGRILEPDRKKAIPDVQIISKNNLVGTFSDENGYFVLLVTPDDSLQFSSLGYATTVVAITDSILSLDSSPVFQLPVDTIQMHEIIIRGYPSWLILKQRIANMKPQDRPWNVIDYMNDNPLLYLKPNTSISVGGPVQFLYNKFNSEVVLQRQLIRNRRKYNRNMIRLGRIKDTISAIPDYMRDKIR